MYLRTKWHPSSLPKHGDCSRLSVWRGAASAGAWKSLPLFYASHWSGSKLLYWQVSNSCGLSGFFALLDGNPVQCVCCQEPIFAPWPLGPQIRHVSIIMIPPLNLAFSGTEMEATHPRGLYGPRCPPSFSINIKVASASDLSYHRMSTQILCI